MLGNIKSSYIFKNIFSFLGIISKIKFIKYNKSLQKIFQITLIDYRRFSRTYIIYEENGGGKEYDALKNTLIYEGGFLKGKRNGNGKLFYEDGKTEYIGNFLNGKLYGFKRNMIDKVN